MDLAQPTEESLCVNNTSFFIDRSAGLALGLGTAKGFITFKTMDLEGTINNYHPGRWRDEEINSDLHRLQVVEA